MEKNKKILEFRARLDKTLALPDLMNEEALKSLVKNQILLSSLTDIEGNVDLIVEERTREISNFLDMLRSASGDEETLKANGATKKDWKIKQDTDQLRVLYCEGPHGSPFHTLLAEGFADGPVDVCLCVSWETTLYRKWFPQYNMPTFKIAQSDCLKKVRIGEEISLIRVKVPWPVSEREALLHYFEIEYLQEDLVLVLIKTISDVEHIDIKTHGFTREGIPEEGETIRIDLVGGFVLQRITEKRSYFRAIANMDIKLDFVPPWLINFIARQLIGNGHKLYQKAVSTVATSDEEYKQALRGPLYARIREYLQSDEKAKVASTVEVKKTLTAPIPEKCTAENAATVADSTSTAEIVEEEIEQNKQMKLDQLASGPSSKPGENLAQNIVRTPGISPEVDRALGILDTAIAVLRQNNGPSSKPEHLKEHKKSANFEAASKASHTGTNKNLLAATTLGVNNLPNSHGTDSPAKDSRAISQWADGSGNHRRSKPMDSTITTPMDSTVTKMHRIMPESVVKVREEGTLKANIFHRNDPKISKSNPDKKNNRWLCCLIPSIIGG